MVLLVTVPVAIILLSIVVQPDQQILDEYQQRRILAWLNPEEYSSDEAYQQNNSVIAIGSGQLTGKGLNNNSTTSVKNGNFILEPQTDFIFAIVGEELGFVGCCIFYCIAPAYSDTMYTDRDTGAGYNGEDHMLRGRLPHRDTDLHQYRGCHPDHPNTGIPLPFVSYGLTSLGACTLA